MSRCASLAFINVSAISSATKQNSFISGSGAEKNIFLLTWLLGELLNFAMLRFILRKRQMKKEQPDKIRTGRT